MASLGLRPIHLQPLPYNSQKILPKLGGGGPWASRWDSHQTPSAQQSQARNGNRISFNFWNTRPQWAGLNEKRHSDFARRKFCSTLQVRVPRNGGPRGRATWRQGRRSRFCRLRPPPGGSLVTFWPSRKSLAARRRRNPPAQNHRSGASGRPCPTERTTPRGSGGKPPPYRDLLTVPVP